MYKKFLSTMIKIKKPKVQQLLPREQGINNGHKVRRQSISQERGSRLGSFVVRRMFTEGISSLSHPVTSVLGAACCSTGFWQQKLIRNRIYEEQHVGILLLNIPWQFLLIYNICKKGFDNLSLFSSNNFEWRQWWMSNIIVKTVTKITVPDQCCE